MSDVSCACTVHLKDTVLPPPTVDRPTTDPKASSSVVYLGRSNSLRSFAKAAASAFWLYRCERSRNCWEALGSAFTCRHAEMSMTMVFTSMMAWLQIDGFLCMTDSVKVVRDCWKALGSVLTCG